MLKQYRNSDTFFSGLFDEQKVKKKKKLFKS